MPVLLGKSSVRSSHVSCSLGRRIQSAHLLCNFHKREKKKKERTHYTKTSLTIHFFSYVPCTLGHKHGGNSWVAECDFSLFLQFPFHFFPPSPSLTLRIVHCHYSPPSLHFTLHALEIPKTSLFSTPSLLKILLYLTYFSHRLIHSFFLLRISYFQFIFCYTPFAVYGLCYFPLSV